MLFGEVEPRSNTQSGVSEAKLRAISPMPLERRVRRCPFAPAASSFAPDDDLKNRMRLSDTEAIYLFLASGSTESRNLLSRDTLGEPVNSFLVPLPEFCSRCFLLLGQRA